MNHSSEFSDTIISIFVLYGKACSEVSISSDKNISLVTVTSNLIKLHCHLSVADCFSDGKMRFCGMIIFILGNE